MTRGLGPAAIFAALALAGCGGGRSGLTPSEQTQLLGLIGKARTAAAAGNPDAAQAALGQLRTRITHLRLAGVLDPARAARMQTVAAQAQSAARAQSRRRGRGRGRGYPSSSRPLGAGRPGPGAGADRASRRNLIQGADDLQGRVDKGVGKIKAKINQLRQTLSGQGQGGGGGGGGD